MEQINIFDKEIKYEYKQNNKNEKNHKLYLGDNLEILKTISNESIDMIFADPPYNMQTDGELIRVEGTTFKGVNDDWDKYNSYNDFLEYTKNWILECKRILKKNGSLWIIGSFQNIYSTGHILLTNGFWILNDIIWEKSNPVPNMKGTRFCNAHETLIRCVKDKNAKATFNYKTMKHLNGGKQMKSVWNIPLCTGKERLITENGEKLHNTQKPLKLLENIILSSTRKDDVILDPFSGTATTGVAAIKYKRQYIGIEKEKKYLDSSKDRLENVEISNDIDLIENTYDIPLTKVTMEELIDKGYLRIGQEFYDNKYILRGILNRNGYILDNETKENFSIHKLSAKILNKTNNNGWDFWFIKENDKFVLIDDFRHRYRKIELGE
ncbi:MAG: site-specific DNA-methyltransferase [Defluviitaleaceae bacterium]|nr:site-specific DNA-methyltransferase [Defluviitaleaceae bacterium]